MFNWVLNKPPQFSIFCHPSSTYATFLGSCSNFRVRMNLVSLAATSDWASPNHTCCQLHSTMTNNLNRSCYKTLNFFAESRCIYFFSDPPHRVIQDLVNHTFYVAQRYSSGDKTRSLQRGPL